MFLLTSPVCSPRLPQALQRNPRYFHALYHLGLVLALRGEAREAIARLDAAAALRPRDWRIMEARARVLQVGDGTWHWWQS